MAEVTGLTAQRMLDMEAASITNGEIVGDDLILIQHNGAEINAGNVRGPQGATGPTGPAGTAVADGVFSASSPDAARAANNWSIVTGTWAEDFDFSNWFDASTGRYTPQKAGYYRISGSIAYTTLGSVPSDISGIGLAQLGKNGTLLGNRAGGSTIIQSRLGGGSIASFSTIVYMNGTTDYLEISSYVESDGSVAVNGTAFLNGEFIGA